MVRILWYQHILLEALLFSACFCKQFDSLTYKRVFKTTTTDYLFGSRQRVGIGSKKTKFGQLVQDLNQLTIKFPNFQIYITGHSLGGALANLASFVLSASDNELPRPIVCITVASPKVGATGFRHAFQVMCKLSISCSYLREFRFFFSFHLFLFLGDDHKPLLDAGTSGSTAMFARLESS